jgi:hypothetical protein
MEAGLKIAFFTDDEPVPTSLENALTDRQAIQIDPGSIRTCGPRSFPNLTWLLKSTK